MARKKKVGDKFSNLEGVLSSIVIENEYKIWKQNNDTEYAEVVYAT